MEGAVTFWPNLSMIIYGGGASGSCTNGAGVTCSCLRTNDSRRLGAGTATVTSPQFGTFKDTSGQPFAHIASGYSFEVIADDGANSTIFQCIPKIDTTVADDAPGTDPPHLLL